MRLDVVYRGLSDADTIVAKTFGVRPVAQIARIETRLRAYLLAEWLTHARRAGPAALEALLGAPEAVSDDYVEEVALAVDRVMVGWAGAIGGLWVDELERVYKLARAAGWRKATGDDPGSLQYGTAPFRVVQLQKAPRVEPDFDVVDTAAVAALRRNQLFWIGDHYSRNLSRNIREVVRTTIVEQGRSRDAAAKVLERRLAQSFSGVRVPSGWSGTSRAYFEALTANAATTARVQGSLRSFAKAGVEAYEIVNPIDDRTCPVCSHMDGKVFYVGDAGEMTENEIAAKTPDDVRKIHPWLSEKKMAALAPTKGNAGGPGGAQARALKGAGFIAPPFHFRCRCTIDVVVR